MEEMDKMDQTRRGFLRRAASVAGRGGIAGGLLACFVGLRGSNRPPAGARGPLGTVRPPGSLEEPEFLAKCIRCTRCADACEAQCIRFFGPEAGKQQNTPYIMPIERGCTLCLKCGEACPTGAILPLEEKKDAKMGTAEIDERLCVCYNGTGVCGACFTVCPRRNKAITQEIRLRPIIHEDECTGCGMCEEHCIVDDRPGLRAIMVNSKRTVGDFEAGPMSPGRSTVEVSS